jgi:protein-S-isoprenylcysteine O-methyltransferase Ste14
LTLGTAIIVSGISFYYACVATLGESFRIGGDPGAKPRLITHGVYSRIRHPIYTSIQWELFGAALVYPCAFTVAAIPVALIGATLQARREERWWLAHDAQAYEAYIARTGRFLPKTR